MTLKDKQKRIISLIKEWKYLLRLSDFNHKTVFYDESNPPQEDDVFDLANNSIDAQKGTMYIKFNNDALIKMTERSMRYNVIHELTHAFFSGVYVLFKNTMVMFNEKSNSKLDKDFDLLEHKAIARLCQAFEGFYCYNKRLSTKLSKRVLK
ncbi:MAG: hypothetical protein EHM14_15880 [Methanothrix sp.]|nr:MAG: hypothetical protein EHM14_15880 [Methanothrix sp.]